MTETLCTRLRLREEWEGGQGYRGDQLLPARVCPHSCDGTLHVSPLASFCGQVEVLCLNQERMRVQTEEVFS